MQWLDFFAYVLAVGSVIDVWRNGSIFAGWRANVEAEYELGKLWARLLVCPYCLSFHIPWILAAASWLLYLSLSWLLPEHAELYRLPVYSLAVTRASFLINGLLPAYLSYERSAYDQSSADE